MEKGIVNWLSKFGMEGKQQQDNDWIELSISAMHGC